MELWLLRHADAEPRAPSGLDQDRSLSPSGRACCHDLQAWIRDCAMEPPALVLVSPARRTLETARTALSRLDFPDPVTESALWNASAGDLVHLLDQQGPHADKGLMLIAHNPGLGDLVRWLGGRLPPTGMKAGTLVVLEVDLPLLPGAATTLASFQPSELI